MSSELELDSELDNGKSDYYPVCVVLCLGCRAREPIGKAPFKGFVRGARSITGIMPKQI